MSHLECVTWIHTRASCDSTTGTKPSCQGKQGTHLLGHHGSLDSVSDSVHSSSHSQVVKSLVLLTNDVLCVNPGPLNVPLSQSLTERGSEGG